MALLRNWKSLSHTVGRYVIYSSKQRRKKAVAFQVLNRQRFGFCACRAPAGELKSSKRLEKLLLLTDPPTDAFKLAINLE